MKNECLLDGKTDAPPANQREPGWKTNRVCAAKSDRLETENPLSRDAKPGPSLPEFRGRLACFWLPTWIAFKKTDKGILIER